MREAFNACFHYRELKGNCNGGEWRSMAASMGGQGHAASRPLGRGVGVGVWQELPASPPAWRLIVSASPLAGPCPSSLLPCLYTEPCMMKKRECLPIIA